MAPPTSMVQNAYYERNLKREYFNSLKDEQKFFKKIMSNEKQNCFTGVESNKDILQKFSAKRLSGINIAKKSKNKSENLFFPSEERGRYSLSGKIQAEDNIKENQRFAIKNV